MKNKQKYVEHICNLYTRNLCLYKIRNIEILEDNFNKKYGIVPIYAIWKNSQIITINWGEQVFCDTDIVNLQEQNRRQTYSLSKECKIADSQIVSDKVDNYLNKRMRLCYAG